MDAKKDSTVMIDRYVYDVTRRLPKAQRQDIDAELRGLIEDMLEQRSPNPEKKDVEQVLIELGRPSALAAKYRGSNRVLIGPELFDTYFLVLKIVVGVAALGITLALIISLFSSPPDNVWAAIGNFFATVISGVVQAFAYVTIVFAVIERFADRKTLKQDDWKPADLPEVPKTKTRIGYTEPIAGMVFIVVVLMIVNISPEVIGIYTVGESLTITPVFNLEVFSSMLILINIILCLGIIKEALRLISARYTLRLAAAVTAINIVSVILVITVFLPPAIWNQEMISTLGRIADMTWAESLNLEYWWSVVPKIVVGLTVFGSIIEIINSFVLGARNAVR